MRKMVCKAITRKKAEWIGMAAAWAGGYIAVDGPRIERISRESYKAIQEDTNDVVAWRAERAQEELNQYHALPTGGYARILPPHSKGDLVMIVPADHPLAEEGYILSRSLLRELLPQLAETGYDTTGILEEASQA